MSSLEVLLAKDEIREVTARYCFAIDLVDPQLFLTCFHPDAVLDYGFFTVDPKTFAETSMKGNLMYETSHHRIATQIIKINGEEARSITYVRAIHAGEKKPEGTMTDLIIYARYFDKWEKRDGAWKIVYRSAVIDWNATHPGTVSWTSDMFAPCADRRMLRDGADDIAYQVFNWGE